MLMFLRCAKPVAYLIILAMVNLGLPYAPARAELVSTETLVGSASRVPSDRERLRGFLQREEVRAAIEGYGVSPEEAVARVDSLTDEEVALVVARLDQLPAGQGTWNGDEMSAAVAGILAVLVLLGVLIWWGVKELTD